MSFKPSHSAFLPRLPTPPAPSSPILPAPPPPPHLYPWDPLLHHPIPHPTSTPGTPFSSTPSPTPPAPLGPPSAQTLLSSEHGPCVCAWPLLTPQLPPGLTLSLNFSPIPPPHTPAAQHPGLGHPHLSPLFLPPSRPASQGPEWDQKGRAMERALLKDARPSVCPEEPRCLSCLPLHPFPGLSPTESISPKPCASPLAPTPQPLHQLCRRGSDALLVLSRCHHADACLTAASAVLGGVDRLPVIPPFAACLPATRSPMGIRPCLPAYVKVDP